ncbi:hypothetical protein G210_0879 [Candida maltosa Xu316]|uniref:Uncharacterized protein n=1 Tax=Candida maltosa (strain Xu316) TaxID=1245528 RepID=M3JZU4_CANMX|nr:hypothetical protein G210_0879 [Candida maltosa Xu316]
MTNQRPKLSDYRMQNKPHDPRHSQTSSARLSQQQQHQQSQQRIRSFTEPSLFPRQEEPNYYRPTQSAQELTYVEDSEDEIPVLLSSRSTSLPRFSSMFNEFDSSFETSQVLTNYHCHESSQLNNENFNAQDFAMPEEMNDDVDFYNSQAIAIADNENENDPDVVLLYSQKVGTESNSNAGGMETTKKVDEGYDDAFETNIQDDESTEEVVTTDVLSKLDNIPSVDEVDGVPNEDEIMECSTQCDEEDLHRERQLENEAVAVVNPPPPMIMAVDYISLSQDSYELKEAAKPKMTEALNTTDGGCNDDPDVAMMIDNDEKNEEVTTNDVLADVEPMVAEKPIEEEIIECSTKPEEELVEEIAVVNEVEEQVLPVPVAKKTDKKKKKPTKKESIPSVAKKSIKDDTSKTENKSKYFAKNESTKKAVQSDNTTQPVVAKESKVMSPPTTKEIAKINSPVVNDTNQNKENQVINTKTTKVIRKRVGSKPLSEICNQHPRARVGLSKRVRIDSLHNNLKKKKPN